MLTCQCQGRLHLFHRLHFDATSRGPAPKARALDIICAVRKSHAMQKLTLLEFATERRAFGSAIQSLRQLVLELRVVCVSGGTPAKKSPLRDQMP
jgi:hypothetical protein